VKLPAEFKRLQIHPPAALRQKAIRANIEASAGFRTMAGHVFDEDAVAEITALSSLESEISRWMSVESSAIL
jgi:hypothetical protein